MTHTLTIGTPPIDVVLRRSARARRLSLRVSGLDGRVSLTVPNRGSLREAEAFLQQKEPWIRKHLAKSVSRHNIAFGQTVPVEGVMKTVVEGPGRSVSLSDTEIICPANRPPTAPIKGLMKTLARDRIADHTARYAAEIDQTVNKITLRDTRSRWGSCSSDKNLMFSWRLIMAPPTVLEYVVAHEVAHLVEMNHSAAFWAQVQALMPDYETHRTWLRKQGQTLHQYAF